MLFGVKIEYSDHFRENRNGTKKMQIKIINSFKDRESIVYNALVRVTKTGEIFWDIPEECPEEIKKQAIEMFAGEDHKRLFDVLKKRKGLTKRKG